MSYDFALKKRCSHELKFESVFYDSITGVVKFDKPPANNNVNLYIDGALVPPQGLWSCATLTFTNSGPYRIKKNTNDLLLVKMKGGTTQNVELLTGYVQTSDMVTDLQRKIPDLVFTENSNKITVSSRMPSKGTSFIFADPRWTDKTSSLPNTQRALNTYARLGVIPGRNVYGRQIFPPWSILKDPNSPLESGRIIQILGGLRNHDPVIQISYVTSAESCRRCHGSRMEFDYNILNSTYETVDDADLLSQEFDKFLFTRLGSHWKWNWLGSNLINRIGSKGSTAFSTVNAMLSLDVNQAFITYQNIKSQQDSQFPQQRVSDAEFPYAIRAVNVFTMPDDPTIALVNVAISSRSTEPVTLKRIVGNPNSYTIGANLSAMAGLATVPDFQQRG